MADRDRDTVRATIQLLDYRRRVAAVYAGLRERGVDEAGWRWWRQQRDELFAAHPMSPIPPQQRAGFRGLDYFAHDPAFHLGPVPLTPVEPVTFEIGHSATGGTPARRFATLEFELLGQRCSLPVYWLDVYGGGVFVPFRDATSGTTTYGGGRYLFDTVKSADLGGDDAHLLVDFNFAYHPSCVHDPAWSCPLAPADERLPVAIEAGERLRVADPLA
ncbi:MAG TPA: DUF1684 domain-containing protein [Egicoccus sp.]|nr:DUF1684 domain-containing protein [Egicoccus sp.]HSK24771.1 DUF1684 domain-containing protein [Egicoccus sp.]